MANRSLKVRQIFAELRSAIGDEIPAGELLRLAAALVNTSSAPDTDEGYGESHDRYICDQLPLDEVLFDGGWRLVATERGWFSDEVLDNDPRVAITRSRKINVELAA